MFYEWRKRNPHNQIVKYINCDGVLLTARLYGPYSFQQGQYTAYIETVLSFRFKVTIVRHLENGINELAIPTKVFTSDTLSTKKLKEQACKYAIEKVDELNDVS